MYYLYNFLATVLFIFVILPYFTVRYFREKGFPRRFRQSMGFIRDDEIAAVAHKNCIWIHGASVGKSWPPAPWSRKCKAMPDAKILVSAVTTGGYNMAHQIIRKQMPSFIFRWICSPPSHAEYIAHLGAEKRRIFVTGNTKFDQTYAEVTPADLQQYKRRTGPGG